jgi:hypothetical protein
MALLSKAEIFGQDDRKYEVVDVPEWGGSVRIRSLTGTERDEYEESLLSQRNGKAKAVLKNYRAKLVALCAVDDAGDPLFDKADVMRLGNANSAALDRLYEACQRLSGLSDEDIEELTENFDETPEEPSTSGSPHTSVSQSVNSSSAPAPSSSPSGWPTNGTQGHSVPNATTSTQR